MEPERAHWTLRKLVVVWELIGCPYAQTFSYPSSQLIDRRTTGAFQPQELVRYYTARIIPTQLEKYSIKGTLLKNAFSLRYLHLYYRFSKIIKRLSMWLLSVERERGERCQRYILLCCKSQ